MLSFPVNCLALNRITWGIVKAALEEWRHWLEGAEQPFLVWTDHKNLEYVCRAKRINLRQARWTLFFSRFNFVVTFRPGSANVKPDSLSRIHDPDNSPKSPEPILPNTCVVGGVSWEIEDLVLQALQGIDVPENCPTGRLFVPDCLRSKVIHWSHSSQLSCHPGIKRTLSQVKLWFWWPDMETAVAEYVAACPVCARCKPSRQAPAGQLLPLPIPSRPWSDISLDFVTGLPTSEGNTTILTVVELFQNGALLPPSQDPHC